MIETILGWYDVAWFWFGRVIGAMWLMAFAIGIGAMICDYIFNKIVNITIFAEFMAWRKREVK